MRHESMAQVLAQALTATLRAAQVLKTDLDTQKAIGPYLKNPVLRRVIQTFTNDPEGDVSRWATNPEACSLPLCVQCLSSLP